MKTPRAEKNRSPRKKTHARNEESESKYVMAAANTRNGTNTQYEGRCCLKDEGINTSTHTKRCDHLFNGHAGIP